MARFTLEWIASPKDEGKLLREFLKERWISRQALTDIKFNGGDIQVNKQEATVRYVLKEKDCINIYFPPEVISEGMEIEEEFLHIVYEDDYVLLINKQPGVPSIPSREHPRGTLANQLLGYYKKIKLESTVHIVNRLDKDTSGLMLVAKNRYVHHLFSLQQREKEIQREYVALVEGILVEESGTIDAPIGRSDDSIIERKVRQDGQQAVTHYQILERSEDYTVVLLKLETGRTHQIRVHMAYLGNPLLGDDLYGGRVDEISRQALHSTSISFYHPILKKEMYFKVEVPDDMKKVIEK